MTTSEILFTSGMQYSAQKLRPEDVWCHFGDINSKPLNDIKEFKGISTDEKNALYRSKKQSIDGVFINNNVFMTKEPVKIDISDDFENSLQPKSKSRRGSRNFNHAHSEITLIISVEAAVWNGAFEGWLHHQIVDILNTIDGIEYYSANYQPILKISKKFVGNEKPEVVFKTVGKFLIENLTTIFSEIDKVKVHFIVGKLKNEALKTRIKIEDIVRKKRRIFSQEINTHNEMSKMSDINYYSLNRHSTRAPFYKLILSPLHYDPAGYITHKDLTNNRWTKQLLQKYCIESKKMGAPIITNDDGDGKNTQKYQFYGLNEEFSDLSFSTISQVENLTKNSFPFSPQVDIIIIPFGSEQAWCIIENSCVVNNNNTNPSFEELIEAYADGHSHPFVMGTSRYYLLSEEFLQKSNGWQKVGWMSAGLKQDFQAFIPENLHPKISTENDVKNLKEISAILNEKNHPLSIKREAFEFEKENILNSLKKMVSAKLQFTEGSLTMILPFNNTNYKITLKNAHITADTLTIEKVNRTMNNQNQKKDYNNDLN